MFAARLLTTDSVQATQVHVVVLTDVAAEFHHRTCGVYAQAPAQTAVPSSTQFSKSLTGQVVDSGPPVSTVLYTTRASLKTT